MSERTTVRLARNAPAVVTLSVEWATPGPGWDEALLLVASEALGSRQALAITPDPPVWDLDPNEVCAQIQALEVVGNRELLLPFAGADQAALRAVVSSNDFRLGTLLLTALPADDLTRIEALLAAVLRATATTSVETDELLLRCFDDHWLEIYNLSQDTLGRVRAGLSTLADQRGWAFDDNTSEEI